MGGLCGRGEVGSANTKDNDATKGSGNSLKESLANIFTPNDNMKYQDGVLVDTSKGEGNYTPVPYKAGAFYDIPEKSNNINVTNTNRSNRIFTPDEQANFTQKNSAREDLANILKPFDGASYVGGNLIDETTGQSLTGGGYATNKAGVKNYIYGVSDDFTNNAPLKQGKMSNKDYTLALAKQSMLQNIPPSDPAYFSSFIPGLTIPLVGGYVGSKMLEGGINERRAMMDQHQAALDGGAKAKMSKDNVYLGYTTADGEEVLYVEEPTAPAPAATTDTTNDNRDPDPLTDTNLGALGLGLGGGVYDKNINQGGTVVPLDEIVADEFDKSTSMNPNTIVYASPLYDYFQTNILPDIVRQKPDMNQDDIDAAFLIYRYEENSVVAN